MILSLIIGKHGLVWPNILLLKQAWRLKPFFHFSPFLTNFNSSFLWCSLLLDVVGIVNTNGLRDWGTNDKMSK